MFIADAIFIIFHEFHFNLFSDHYRQVSCRRCSHYTFILDLTPGFIGLGKYNFKTSWETFKFGDLVRLILEMLR